MNAQNLRLLRKYKTICRNKGLTESSIEAAQADLRFIPRFEERQLGDKHAEIFKGKGSDPLPEVW